MKKFTLFAGLLTAACALYGSFEVKEGTLTVKSKDMTLETRDGMIQSLRMANGEQFCKESSAFPDAPFRRSLFPEGPEGKLIRKNAKEARWLYELDDNVKLFYDFKIDGGDILVRIGVDNLDMSKNNNHLDLHVLFMTPEAVITGIGSKTLRKDPDRNENLYWTGSAFHFPRVLMAEGKKNLIMFHNESSLPYHNILFFHTPDSDHVVLRGMMADTFKLAGMNKIHKKSYLTGYWRISRHNNWLEAAKAWQKGFEKRTGATPLWKNKSKYIRNIHAIFTGTPNEGWKENPDEYYKKMAAEYDPASIILFYWNAGSLVTLCDHTYTLKPYPSDNAVKALKKHGFNWMAFHGYTLVCNEDAIAARHAPYIKAKKMPPNYKFSPDYQGKPEDFYKNMAPYLSRRSAPYGMLNPAAKYVEDYLVQNIGNYAKYHKIPGFYMDITGHLSLAVKPDKRVFEGKTYIDGDVNVFHRLREKNPDLLMMTEYCGEWIIPYIFYCWEGDLILRHKDVRINHPLRGALYGTYIWTRENTRLLDDPVLNAYYATLPEITNDFGSAQLSWAMNSTWMNERAKLFIREKLFNALPDQWDDDAIAYYRSAKNGFFQFRKMPFGYAFTDAKKNVLLGIYEKQTKGLPGKIISDWCAYDKNGAAIGLNPKHAYRFHSKAEKINFNVTELTPGCYFEFVRHINNNVRTMFRINSASKKNADFTVSFKKQPIRVYLNGIEQNISGKEWKVAAAALPANVQLVFEEPKSHTAATLPKSWGWIKYGYTGENGLHISHGYRSYAENITGHAGKFKFAGKVKDTLHVGSGKFRRYVEKVVDVPANVKTLTFSVALDSQKKKKNISYASVLKIYANGKEIFHKTIPSNSKAWQDFQTGIAEFAGKKVIFHIEFGYEKPEDVKASVQNHVIHIGDLNLK
ncbi:MAG: hypothetical protein IKB16_12895 [Lentisphaeria bacterium]|nr:hypothetical protein [Lentisphaeria bacterium]